MKKSRKKQFLDELRKLPVTTIACKRVDITRQTVYRWNKEDKEFSRQYQEAKAQGCDDINDLAISQIITLIQRGDFGAVKYWLAHNHEQFIKHGTIIHREKPEQTLADLLREGLARKPKDHDNKKD